MYRPKGMKNPHSYNPDPDKVYMWTRHDDFEAGADAYEEGLIKSNWLEHSTDDSYKVYNIPVNRKGYLVFIEEDIKGGRE